MITVCYVNPAGNKTAVVKGTVAAEARVGLARAILKSGKAEQVGFETEPLYGGDCRLEMMGGEFCGNATRAFGYLKAAEQHRMGNDVMQVEISGTDRPVPVEINLDEGTAYTRMPLPVGMDLICVNGRQYPVIRMEGITHLIAGGCRPEQEFVRAALQEMESYRSDACGVLFLEQDHLTPVVYVKSTDSLVWESSCGSGSTACAWYLAGCSINAGDESARYVRSFRQPGGVIETSIAVQDRKIVCCMMGGNVEILEEMTIEEDDAAKISGDK